MTAKLKITSISIGGIRQVDIQKAYDLVNREFLWRILDFMGFPTAFVRWLQSMYSVGKMSILNVSEVAGVGTSLFNEKLIVRAFGDDVTIFISYDKDFTRAGQFLDLFYQWTKARMNKEKQKPLYSLEQIQSAISTPKPMNI
ncbi:hypothetical protein OUZ56_017311 [Daphnia magna]|uniref:Reverse transcriptase domain-containing protein n=1 Tax=Daphnia magna TaxID=35525 RepID=A0ABR0ASM8_9CRUS|nr:hypothetical protein OUZ56_017311 [Daphnia magna]